MSWIARFFNPCDELVAESEIQEPRNGEPVEVVVACDCERVDIVTGDRVYRVDRQVEPGCGNIFSRNDVFEFRFG